MVHSKRCHSSVWAHNCTNIVVWEQFPTSGVSSQCPDTGIQLLCNLIKNVCFSVRQLPLAHQLSYKQNFWIPDWNDIICCAIYLQK
ncbi:MULTISPECIES: hypothetical protein [unclassified Wolbachia]|uniref:hypothetical protein n=1 Tax=unclassified Wolbachia TaxID=2640676 RepID=UPI002227BB28|nr:MULTISPECIES: hypothetical protein [unclassified Wolbachia]MBV2146154.1 hypothetical protein [Wolbachia endosymbiont of Pissodes strobi]MDX5495543.1 hypothetical protein [Wolbachia endosymbiont of Nomada marshamella]WMT84594.1 hypothetical protein NMD99_00780 [Wolbachia endosymbiont of Listronotus oregonensis]